MQKFPFDLTKACLRIAVPLAFAVLVPAAQAGPLVLPSLLPDLVTNYDWEHPVAGNPTKEDDQGFSGTDINLINGGAAMRVADGAFKTSQHSIQTQQITPASNANNDEKAGIYQAGGLPSLSAFNAVKEITMMGWVKPTGTNPSLNSETANPADFFNAVGLFGILQGGAGNNGHNVRALLEIIDVNGTLRLVALARRVDTGASQTFWVNQDWHTLLPQDQWTHLTATFNFDTGVMALYRNGVALAGSNLVGGNPWALTGGVDVTSATNPGGIKIGGSFPQNSEDRNPFNGRFDDIMMFDRVLSAAEVAAQYDLMVSTPEPSTISIALLGLAGIAGLGMRRRRAGKPAA